MVEKFYLRFPHLSLEKLTPFEKSQFSAYMFAIKLDQAVHISSLLDAYSDAEEVESIFLDLAYKEYLKESLRDEISH